VDRRQCQERLVSSLHLHRDGVLQYLHVSLLQQPKLRGSPLGAGHIAGKSSTFTFTS
jgi:hypothetical protein